MKSRRKKQLACLNNKQEIQEITLQQAWDRVCEELDQRNDSCYFVNSYSLEDGWELTTGSYSSITIVKQSGGKN